MNYELKNIYENMRLTQSFTVPKKNSNPRTLTEAYKIINERNTVFITKEGDLYHEIGSVESDEDAQKIKNNIRSYSITSLTSSLLEKSGWSKKNPLISPLKLGTLIFLHKIDIKDFAKINENRENNSLFENFIFSESGTTTFNIVDILTKGIENLIGQDQKTQTNKIEEILNELIPIKGDIDGIGVGPGELAISLFTNSVKGPEGKKGDLHFSKGVVEVKGSSNSQGKTSGAALGYAKYATSGNLEKAIDSLLEQTSIVPDRNANSKVVRYNDAVDKLKSVLEALPGKVSFNDKFYNTLRDLSKNFLKMNLNEIQQKLADEFYIKLKPGNVSIQSVNDIIKGLRTKGYLEKNTSMYIDEADNQIKEKLKNYLYGSKSSFIQTLNQILRPSENTKLLNLNEKFKDLFLSNLGFNAKQLAGVLIEARPTDNTSVSIDEITSVLNQGYLEKLKRGDTKALNALVFALHIKCYATEEVFDRLLLINQTTHNSIVVPTHKSFKDLVEFYITNEKNFTFSITFINTRGVHNLGIK